MREDSILNLFRLSNTVFTFKDIALIWGEANFDRAKSRINYYVKTGKLYAVRRGIYAKDKNYNTFELATKIYTPSYISFETVLSREGVVFQHYDKIFVASYLTREIICDHKTYSFKKIKDTALMNPLGIEKKDNYSIAIKERAFLDMLYLYKEYYFDNMGSINWDFCLQLLSIYENKTLTKKLDSYRINNHAR